MVLLAPLLLGAVALAFGALLLARPYRMARLHARLSALGARGWASAEPAGWYVLATRAVGVGFLLVGAWSVLLAFAPDLAGRLVP